MRRELAIGLVALGVGISAGGELACSPGARETVREVAPPAQRALCILLRAVTTSGTLDEVCATLDELAPLVPEILARRESGETPPSAAQALRVAAAFEAPPRPVARRRCVQWVPIASLTDAGGARLSEQDSGGADGGSDGGRR